MKWIIVLFQDKWLRIPTRTCLYAVYHTGNLQYLLGLIAYLRLHILWRMGKLE